MSRNVKIESVQIIQPKFKAWEHENYKLLKWLQIVSVLACVSIGLLYYMDKINGVSAFAIALVISIIPILVERFLKISQCGAEERNKEGYTYDDWVAHSNKNKFKSLRAIFGSEYGLIFSVQIVSPLINGHVLDFDFFEDHENIVIDISFVEGLQVYMVRDLVSGAVSKADESGDIVLTNEEKIEIVINVLAAIETPPSRKDL